MSKGKDVGVFQLENGNWEFRYVVIVDGKTVSSRKRTDEVGNKLRTKRQAIISSLLSKQDTFCTYLNTA